MFDVNIKNEKDLYTNISIHSDIKLSKTQLDALWYLLKNDTNDYHINQYTCISNRGSGKTTLMLLYAYYDAIMHNRRTLFLIDDIKRKKTIIDLSREILPSSCHFGNNGNDVCFYVNYNNSYMTTIDLQIQTPKVGSCYTRVDNIIIDEYERIFYNNNLCLNGIHCLLNSSGKIIGTGGEKTLLDHHIGGVSKITFWSKQA